ncbi:hypothetical protein SFRURICE_018125 [Spodoptera frugiperda]|nr:hypothetical protein SFRURICE_018125 [Spodoptera frugiperda]
MYGCPCSSTAYVFLESGCDVAASFPDVTRATVARYHVYPGNCQWILILRRASNRHHRTPVTPKIQHQDIFRPPGQLRNLLRSPKDKDPLAVPGVYMIPCDCGSMWKNRDTHTSAVAEHACSAGTTHFLRFDKVSVLAREKYFVPRKVREAIEISRRPNFNRDGGWALPPAWKPSLQSASAYNVAGLECDTVSAVCDTVFASTRESNPTPAQPPASESNEPTSSRAPDSTRDSRQRARWALYLLRTVHAANQLEVVIKCMQS